MSEGLSRRSFLKIAGAAGAAAAVPGCEPAARKLIPYVIPDENVIPGVPSFYSTTCTECEAGCGIVARVREGRVVKLEGNPKDPIGQGALCARGQAALQGVYNPDRLSNPQLRGDDGRLRTISWDDVTKLVNGRLLAASQAGTDRIAYLGSPQGPTFDKIAKSWAGAWKSSKAVFYQPISNNAASAAAQKCFGRTDKPVYKIDQAEVLISFGANFLETWESPVEYARQYAAFRTPKERRGTLAIGRSIYVGSRMGITAAKADEFIAITPGHEPVIAMGVLHLLVAQGWLSPNSGFDIQTLKSFVADYDPQTVAKITNVPSESLTRIAQAFGQADGAVALAGTDDELTHIVAHILNAVTGNVGKTVQFLDGQPPAATSSQTDIDALIAAMNAKSIDVLVIANSNPVYSMPPSAKFAEALRQVPFVIWCGGVPDETAERAKLLVPTDHPLEAWRDSAPRAGIFGLGQPATQKVCDTRDLGDLMLSSARSAGASSTAVPWETMADAVNASFQAIAAQVGSKAPASEFWTQVLHDGGVFGEAKPAEVKLDVAVLVNKPAAPAAASGLTLYAYPHIFLYDGRGANKPWLQEIPEPIAQLVWDSWAEIHPDTAASLGVARDDVIRVTTDQGWVEVPSFISEHVSPGVIAIPLGQGHTAYGRYARGRGANALSILPAGVLSAAVTVKSTGGKRKIVSPLYSEDMMGRNIVEAMSIERLAGGGEPEEKPLAPEPYELYAPFEYPIHEWGMTIDVNSCIGCSACVAACYAENNVPFVGREAVEDGRIMSWIRIERYAPPKTGGSAPLMYITPMLCQQCAHAPCEPVCPVFASYHTREGINGQNYNRCVGTRYCENNCPYKVRRFNWFKPEWPAPLNLQLNPDVTVRGAGVMEKCTFCIQRIVSAEIDARVHNRNLRDGEIVPACAQACPAHAISFGDMNDKDSEMMRRRRDNKARSYYVLEDLNTQPAIAYLRDLYHEKGRA
jgi:molybdopterin-containing oxidoreductase family iron-sulfur binding subunit